MEFVNLARDVEIGANSFLIRTRRRQVVLDSGMHPKREGGEALPDFTHLAEGAPDAIVVTHAHQDHVGSLPHLTRRNPKAKVFLTEATARIADVMLHNSVNVMFRQKEEKGIDPLFTHRSVELCREAWQPCQYRIRHDFSGERADDGDTFEFYPAGHILGAAGVLLRMDGRSIFFTGDVNFENQTLIRGADFPESGVDVLIMETTRGDSPLPPGFTRAKEELRLAEAIRAGFEKGGAVTIPVFALGKTQELLGMLWKMRIKGLIPACPIYIGGLSTKISTIYDNFAADPQRQISELQLLHELAPYVLSGNDIASMHPRKRCIFALSSGMMTPNTLSNIFAKKILGDPNQTLLFVGYSDPDSPAAKIRSAAPGDPVTPDPRAPAIPLQCEVNEFNFSAHASRESLLKYAVALRPKKILLVHGDRPAAEWFQLSLFKDLPNTEVVIPEPGARIPL